MKTNSSKQQNGNFGNLLTFARGSFLGLCAYILIIAISALILSTTEISDDMAQLFSYLAAIFGSLLSGYTVSCSTKKNGLMTGLVAGALLFLQIIITKVIFATSNIFSLKTCILLLICEVVSAAGAVMGVNKKIKIK